MICRIKSHFKMLGQEGQATAVLSFHLETMDTDARDRVLQAIQAALVPETTIDQVQPQIGFETSHED